MEDKVRCHKSCRKPVDFLPAGYGGESFQLPEISNKGPEICSTECRQVGHLGTGFQRLLVGDPCLEVGFVIRVRIASNS